MPGNMAGNGGTSDLERRKARERRWLIVLLLVTVPLVVLVAVLSPIGPVFRLFTAASGSMAPTLPAGSHFVVSRMAYGYSRHSFDLFQLPIEGRWPSARAGRGDLIVFRFRKNLGLTFVKRVVGLPGDVIAFKNSVVFLNGEPLRREAVADQNGTSRARSQMFRETLPSGLSYRVVERSIDDGRFDTLAEVTVPDGHVYVLGDNRDNSNDSRIKSAVGFVPIELIIGKVVWHTGP